MLKESFAKNEYYWDLGGNYSQLLQMKPWDPGGGDGQLLHFRPWDPGEAERGKLLIGI